MRLKTTLVIAAAFLTLTILPSPAADTLPSQLSDAAYWKMISDFSEPDKYFQLEIITSNEINYQNVLPQLTKSAAPGGTYLGVGPEPDSSESSQEADSGIIFSDQLRRVSLYN